ncbi:MAG: hypothetical protein NTZ83_00995 [Candidatus Pacearchaeota archaeon]|nr:hypothetical protein [Candidatus Pacearchaeota archaeon]
MTELSQEEMHITSRIKELSDILLETKCKNLIEHNLTTFSKNDIYHLPLSQRDVTIIDSCKMVKKYPFYKRYLARRELKSIYKELPNGQEKDNVKELLFKTGIYSWLGNRACL